MTATALIALMMLNAAQPAPEQVCLLGRVDRASTSSASCLACHDGSAGPPVAFHAAGASVGFAMGTGASGRAGAHPVSVPYALGRREVALRAFGPRDPAVILPGGRVECVTCHSATGAGPRRTVLEFSALCGGCHQK